MEPLVDANKPNYVSRNQRCTCLSACVLNGIQATNPYRPRTKQVNIDEFAPSRLAGYRQNNQKALTIGLQIER